MKDIQILFVDGPTAVGKDYFIGNFKQAYVQRFAHAKVTEVRAADIVLQGQAKSEDRKYTTYATPLELTKTIYKGHIDLLDYLRVQSDLLSSNDLIIVNRSFLSYYIYNFKALLKQYPPQALDDAIKELKHYNLNSYSRQYTKVLHGLSTMFVDLKLPEMYLQEKVDLVCSRIQNRSDGKPVDKDWLRYLLVSYSTPRPAFSAMFDEHTSVESSQYQGVLDNFF